MFLSAQDFNLKSDIIFFFFKLLQSLTCLVTGICSVFWIKWVCLRLACYTCLVWFGSEVLLLSVCLPGENESANNSSLILESDKQMGGFLSFSVSLVVISIF